MRIATLQIASKLGDVQGNIKRADKLLRDARVTAPGESDVSGPGLSVPLEEAKLDILVLPELALTG
jgi:protein N-terminal amidase